MRTLFAICCIAVFAFAQTGAPRSRKHLTASRMITTGGVAHLMGVVIETDSMVLNADTVDFDKATSEMTTHGDVHIRMKQAGS